MNTGDDTKWVVFIDSLSPNDLDRCEFLPDTMKGKMHATPPRVTPRVMSSIYTGLDPAENGMMRSQKFQVENAQRPEQSTVMERAMANGMDVLSLYMPFCIPFNFVKDGSAMLGTAMGGNQNIEPNNMAPQINVPGPSGDLIGDQRHDIAFDHFVDYINQIFCTARTLAGNYDVVFVCIRVIDSYCHFQYDMNENGPGAEQGERYRDKLAEVVDIQLKQLESKGEVLWFSDHGATKKEETFRVNKWLSENDFLQYNIMENFRDQARNFGMIDNISHPVNTRVENQFTPGAPGIPVNPDQSKAISADPFDSCITLIDDDARDEVINELKKLDAYREVYHKSELFDQEGKYYDQTPDIIPDRAEGVFVSGSVHPDPIGMGWYRTGVHDQYGCYGSTTDLEGGQVTPEELNGIVERFIGIDRDVHHYDNLSKLTPEEKKALKRRLDSGRF